MENPEIIKERYEFPALFYCKTHYTTDQAEILVTRNTMIYEIKQSCKFKFVKLYFNLKYKFFDLAKNITVF